MNWVDLGCCVGLANASLRMLKPVEKFGPPDLEDVMSNRASEAVLLCR